MPKFRTIRNGGYENPLQVLLVDQMIELAGQLNSLPHFVQTMKRTMTRRDLTMAQALGDQLTIQKRRILVEHPDWKEFPANIEVSPGASCVSIWGATREVARLDIPPIHLTAQKQQA